MNEPWKMKAEPTPDGIRLFVWPQDKHMPLMVVVTRADAERLAKSLLDALSYVSEPERDNSTIFRRQKDVGASALPR